MQLASYSYGGFDKIGAVVGAQVIDLPQLHQWFVSKNDADFTTGGHFPQTMRQLIDLDQPWLNIANQLIERAAGESQEDLVASGAMVALSDVILGLPVPDPVQIIAIRLNYDENTAPAERDVIEIPTLSMRSTMSLSASGEAIVRPAVSEMLDWEGELAVIIGRSTRHVSIDDAMSAVVGYAPFNDGTVRDWQHTTNQITAGKNFYKSGGFGPWITTVDAALPIDNITMRTRLNGEIFQHINTSEMLFSVAKLISYISAYTELVPGDVIVTGTPSGVGGRQNPPRWLRQGDVISVELEGISVLENPVIEEIEPEGADFMNWKVPESFNKRRLEMLASNRHLSSPDVK